MVSYTIGGNKPPWLWFCFTRPHCCSLCLWEDVVDAVIANMDLKFNSSNNTFWTEGDDSVFFKDLALVESSYGDGENTFRAEELGGIWQVPWREFEDTKDTTLVRANPDYADKVEQILNAFEIQWQDVGWEELLKPLHSLLAARLILHMRGIGARNDEDDVCHSIPAINEKELYVDYWYQCYRNQRGNLLQFEETETRTQGEVCFKAFNTLIRCDIAQYAVSFLMWCLYLILLGVSTMHTLKTGTELSILQETLLPISSLGVALETPIELV